MTALEAIIAWAESDLPEWQSDAVRRLLTQDTLTDDDRQDLLSMLKALHGLLPDGCASKKPQPLRKGMVSGAPTSKTNVTLKALKDLRSINKIPDGSLLPFGHQGLTAIYGENGSGKSGYTRVLKRACRARDTQEEILPNVFGAGMPESAKATFKVSINDGADQEIEWEDGKPSNEVLTNITVFDSKCARVIVDEKNEATYLPYGCHVFEGLVNLLAWMREKIEVEKPKQNDPLQFPEITPLTAPGRFLAKMTHATTARDVEEAVVWEDDRDSKRLEALTRHLAELEANDPAKQAATRRSMRERVTNLILYIDQRANALSDNNLTKYRQAVLDEAEALKAVELASRSTLQDEPLLGAGESAWEILYNSAKEYSIRSAYPSSEFPVVDENARCVLCMQPLTEDARNRFLRFRSFMEQAAKKRHESAKKARIDAQEAIHALKDMDGADQYNNIIGEVRQRDENLAELTASFRISVKTRIDYCNLLFTGATTGELQPLSANPVEALTRLADGLEEEAKSFDRAVDPVAKDRLKEERAELLACKCFVGNRNNILRHLKEIETVHKYDQMRMSISTTAITQKGRCIVSASLTPQLRAAIQLELQLLGIGQLPLDLKPSGSRGETLHQLELKGAKTGRRVNLTDVLSEGEQRVVALAGFFAEIGLGGHSCPIVLDDPVSSLDHRYRTKIAERIVSEAKRRQVLVFTHDIAFLLDLQEKSGDLGEIYFTVQTVLKQSDVTGVQIQGLPWHAMTVGTRLDHLRQKVCEIKELYVQDNSRYDREAAHIYSRLRETWEAAIEEVVLNRTVVRHRNDIQTVRLKDVRVTTDDYKTIYKNISKCSTWMVGHNKSKQQDVHRPEPKEILDDIDALQSFLKECKDSRRALVEERTAALKPGLPPVG